MVLNFRPKEWNLRETDEKTCYYLFPKFLKFALILNKVIRHLFWSMEDIRIAHYIKFSSLESFMDHLLRTLFINLFIVFREHWIVDISVKCRIRNFRFLSWLWYLTSAVTFYKALNPFGPQLSYLKNISLNQVVPTTFPSSKYS